MNEKKKRIEQLDTLDKAILLAIGPKGDTEERVRRVRGMFPNPQKPRR